MHDRAPDNRFEHAIRAAWSTLRRDAAPREVAGYRIERELGRGGMGVVYLARQERLGGRMVALKVLAGGASLSADARARFLRETRALARLRHPGIVTVHDVLEVDGLPAFAMEWVEGPSLRGLIAALERHERAPTAADVESALGAAPGTLADADPVRFGCRVGAAIGHALSAVHSAGLVHRDLKPSNVLLQLDGTALLSDFGLARGREDTLLTKSGAFAGTLAYAAPEQLRGELRALDARSDVYSLGVTLYHLLARRTPYPAESTTRALQAIEEERVPALRGLCPGVPRDLETVVQQAMATEPARRYQTAAELAEDLERVLAGEPVRARRSGPLGRVYRSLRRRRGALVAASVGGVLSAVVVSLLALNAFLVPQHVDELVRSARSVLLNPAHADFSIREEVSAEYMDEYVRIWLPAAGWDPRGRFPAALEYYDRALRFRPGRSALRRERNVVALAAALEAGDTEVPEREGLIARYFEERGGEQRPAGNWSVALESASQEELRDVGLLAYLRFDVSVCNAAWDLLTIGISEDPIVDAARGLLLLQERRTAAASWHLQAAVEAFPELGFLATRAAQCALLLGEVAVARHYVELSGRLSNHDTYDTLARVRGDLAALEGKQDEARTHYHQVIRAHRAELARAHLARVCELAGDWEGAVRLYTSIAAHPDVGPELRAQFRARLGLAAEMGWASLDAEERVQRLVDELELPQLTRGPMVGLDLRLACARDAARLTSRARAHLYDSFEGELELRRSMAGAAEDVSSGPPAALRHLIASLQLWRLPRGLRTSLSDSGREWLARLTLAIDACLAPAVDETSAAGVIALESVHAGVFAVAEATVLPFLVALAPAHMRQPVGPVVTTMRGARANARFGRSISPVADLDGDGRGELLVGGSSSGGLGTLGVYSIRSQRAIWCLEQEPGWLLAAACVLLRDLDLDGVADLALLARAPDKASLWIASGANGRRIRTLELPRDVGALAASLCSLGDLDGDGWPELALGWSGRDPEAGIGAPGCVTVHSAREGAERWRAVGPWPRASLGRRLLPLPDLDSDGCADLALSLDMRRNDSHGLSLQSGRTGKVLSSLRFEPNWDYTKFQVALLEVGDGSAPTLITGHPGMLAVQPPRVDAHSLPDGRLLWRHEGERGDLLGWALEPLPDLDGDAIPEVAASAPQTFSGGRGHVLILSGATGVELSRLIGDRRMTEFGYSLALIGDQDGDHVPDLAVGAPSDPTNGTAAGALWIFSGGQLLDGDGTSRAPSPR